MRSGSRLSANISLTTVILVGALLIVSSMAVLSNAIDVTMSTKSYFNRQMADTRVSTCIEEGMYKLTKVPTYVGTLTVTYIDGSCQVAISNNSGNINMKNMIVTAVYQGFTVTRTKYVTTNTTPMTLSN